MSALSTTKVLELTSGVAGEYCGKLLSDFGAEIIKLENPDGGSPTRHMGPFSDKDGDPESSGLFAYLNTNKRSVALDVTSEAGSRTLQQLLQRVDAVICDYPDGWLRDIGLDAAAVEAKYPGLVVCSITAYGLTDDGESSPAEDINVFHSSGWGYHTPTGADPARPPLSGPGRFLASYEAGLDAALCIVASLYDREESGLGQFIDLSKQAVLASRTDYVLAQMIAGEMNVGPERNAFDLAGPSGILACEDGFVYIWMSAPSHWDAVGEMLGRPEWMQEFPEHWLEKACTPERVALARKHIGEYLKTQKKVEVSDRAQTLGLTMVPVSNAGDLIASSQFQFRGFFQELEHPQLGKVTYPTVPYKLSETPAQLNSPAPLLGQHTEQQLAALSSGGEQ